MVLYWYDVFQFHPGLWSRLCQTPLPKELARQEEIVRQLPCYPQRRHHSSTSIVTIYSYRKSKKNCLGVGWVTYSLWQYRQLPFFSSTSLCQQQQWYHTSIFIVTLSSCCVFREIWRLNPFEKFESTSHVDQSYITYGRRFFIFPINLRWLISMIVTPEPVFDATWQVI